MKGEFEGLDYEGVVWVWEGDVGGGEGFGVFGVLLEDEVDIGEEGDVGF